MKMNAVYVLIGLILGLVACSCLGKTREGFHHKKNKYQEDKKQLQVARRRSQDVEHPRTFRGRFISK